MKRLTAFIFVLAVLVGPWSVWAGSSVPTTASGARNIWTTSYGQTGDDLIKTGPGILHTLVCSSDAVATAGLLEVRDAVAAGAGTIIQSIAWPAANVLPITMIFDVAFATGLYLDASTTVDVTCSVSYR